MKKNYSYFAIVIILFFAIFAGFTFLHSGLPPTHDGEYHIIRFYEFNKTLIGGNFYPRWASDLNNGYGIPIFNYVYPLPNYIASFFHFLGASFIDAFKLDMFFASIFGAIFMYFWSKSFWGIIGGIVSSVFYTFSPYHFVDIYVRGSVGEVWALAFFPAFLWSVTKLIKEENIFYMPISGVFLSFIIFSHNILALMFFAFSLFYIICMIILTEKKLYAIYYSLCAILLGLGLSAIFWLPALLETKYVTGLQIYSVKNNFPEVYQLIIPSWGSGFSNGNLLNQMSPQIGIANLIAILLCAVALIFPIKNKDKKWSRTVLFFMGCFVIAFFLMLPLSLPLWENIPFMNYFQFPWRFLSLEILFASFIAGSIVVIWKNKIVFFSLILLPILFGIGYSKPPYYFNRDDNYYLSRHNFIDGTNSPGDVFNTIWFDKNLAKSSQKLIFTKSNGEILSQNSTPVNLSFSVDVKKSDNIVISLAYFPGWTALVDNKNVSLQHDAHGRISFPINPGMHDIKIKLNQTIDQSIAAWISLVSLIIAIIAIMKLSHGIIKK